METLLQLVAVSKRLKVWFAEDDKILSRSGVVLFYRTKCQVHAVLLVLG